LKTVTADVRSVSPATVVEPVPIHFRDAWDFADVYRALRAFADAYPFDPEREDYLVHITTGTHVVQICLFLLVETRRIPGGWSRPRRREASGRAPAEPASTRSSTSTSRATTSSPSASRRSARAACSS
jgi:transcriptional regulatory protein RtcR